MAVMTGSRHIARSSSDVKLWGSIHDRHQTTFLLLGYRIFFIKRSNSSTRIPKVRAVALRIITLNIIHFTSSIMESIKAKIKNILHHNPTGSNGDEKKLILITGGSGFVATHVLNSFLSRGYHVRATVRSQNSAEKVIKAHTHFKDQLSFAIVKDITTPGAFDEAVIGVDGVRLQSIYQKIPLIICFR